MDPTKILSCFLPATAISQAVIRCGQLAGLQRFILPSLIDILVAWLVVGWTYWEQGTFLQLVGRYLLVFLAAYGARQILRRFDKSDDILVSFGPEPSTKPDLPRKTSCRPPPT